MHFRVDLLPTSWRIKESSSNSPLVGSSASQLAVPGSTLRQPAVLIGVCGTSGRAVG